MKVLLAEDHKMVRQGTRLYLESMGIEVIGEATNGREAIELARKLQPDVVVMDIHLPELTGVEATRRIRHDDPDIRILVLTAYNEPAYVHALLDAGADGFILKTAELAELYQALNEVVVGRKAFDADTLARAEQHITDMSAQIEGLTHRELEVLSHAASGGTNKEIGKLLFISDRTVQGHLKNIYQKFGVTTRTEAVAIGLQHGFITLEGTNEL
ncbi:MAG: response regulator transcription factor [Anaerolineae bacterium]|nr:response regulator transcription factor [Anaerolineae bacterium]